jgi:hypothetical protein
VASIWLLHGNAGHVCFATVTAGQRRNIVPEPAIFLPFFADNWPLAFINMFTGVSSGSALAKK